jgi:hypothetical protein
MLHIREVPLFAEFHIFIGGWMMDLNLKLQTFAWNPPANKNFLRPKNAANFISTFLI